LPGYTGVDVADRGVDPEADAVLTLAQMERTIARWVVQVWQNRRLGEHALSGMEREYIRDRTLEGHESARSRGKSIGGAPVVDEAMLSMALHLREQNLSLRDIAARLVITTGKRRGRHPSAATVLRMFRDHDAGIGAAGR
jgi:hypothetical protein